MVKHYKRKRKLYNMEYNFVDNWLTIHYRNKQYQTDIDFSIPDIQESWRRYIQPLRFDEIFKYALRVRKQKNKDIIGVKIGNTDKKVVFKFFNHKSLGIDV